MLKSIKAPKDVVIDHNGKLTNFSMAMFVESTVNDPQFGTDVSAVESRLEIRQAFGLRTGKPVAAGDVVELRPRDWELLAKVVRQPSNPYIPALGEMFLPFIYAIIHAE